MDLTNKEIINNTENNNLNISNQNDIYNDVKKGEEENEDINFIENLNINQFLIDDSLKYKDYDFFELRKMNYAQKWE